MQRRLERREHDLDLPRRVGLTEFPVLPLQSLERGGGLRKMAAFGFGHALRLDEARPELHGRVAVLFLGAGGDHLAFPELEHGDGHVLEPATLWQDYTEASFRDRALRVEVDVRLARGEFTLEQAADYLQRTVPMDRATALEEAASFAAALRECRELGLIMDI